MMYRRLCATVNDKGTLISSTDDIYKHITTLNKDYYASLYLYNEEQKKTFYSIDKSNGKMRGISGITDVTTNKLVFDFDSADNLNQAKLDTVETIKRLNNLGIDDKHINIYFSGKKGFGLEVTTNEILNPDDVKNICKGIAGDLKTFDPVIFNASRIIRVPFTKHQDSNLYKIPLAKTELNLSITEIKKLAETECEPTDFGITVLSSLPKKVSDLKVEVTEKAPIVISSEVCDLDINRRPKWLSAWKYALSEGYFPSGVRNNALLILGATYQGQGLNKLTAYRMLKGAAELQSQRTGQERFPDEEIWVNIIEQVYSPHWNGGTFAEDNFPDNIKEYLLGLGIQPKKAEENPLTDIDNIYKTFENFAENIEKNTVKTGITELDKLCRITTSMLVGLLGAPGAGKTATILNVINKHSMNGEASVFFSLDMGRPLVYQKMAQKFTGYSSQKIFDIFQNKNEEQKQKIRYLIKNNFNNVQMCFRTGARVEDMKKYIEDYQEKSGKKVRLIAVDYLEKVVGPFSDPTANSGYNAAKLQELANDLEICVLLLLQPQKMAGDPSDPLLTYRRVKGASVIEQDCRVILSVFREGYDPQSYEDDYFITYAILKNTMGELGSVDCFWDGLTGDVSEIDELGKGELAAIRKRKLQKKVLEEL